MALNNPTFVAKLAFPKSDKGVPVGKGEYEHHIRANISRSFDNMSAKAAREVASAIRSFNPTAEKPYLNIGFSTGGAPKGMYAELVRMSKEEGLDFSNVNCFNLDEYIGISYDHPESYHRYMYDNLYDHIPEGRKPHSINIPDGLRAVDEPMAACLDYERGIAAVGGIDLQVIGIGENGHLGFSEPTSDPKSFEKGTSIFDLTESTRNANKMYFNDNIDEVPKQAISMGLGSIMEAKKIIMLANNGKSGGGYKKIDALRAMVYGNITPQCPASILQKHKDITVFLTEESAKAADIHWHEMSSNIGRTTP